MWRCKYTVHCVAEGRRSLSCEGSNYLSHDWKRGEMPVVVSAHISTQETDRRLLLFVPTRIYTTTCRAQAYLCTCSLNREVPVGRQMRVCAFMCGESLLECQKATHVKLWIDKIEKKEDETLTVHKNNTFSFFFFLFIKPTKSPEEHSQIIP